MNIHTVIGEAGKIYRKLNSTVEKGVDKLQAVASKYDPRKDGSNGEEIIIHGTKKTYYGHPFFIRMKHYCKKCNGLLEVRTIEKVVNSFSEEAKKYDFSDSGDTYLVGNIKFITYYFECTDCNTIYSNKELVQIERERGKVRRKKKIEKLKEKLSERLYKNERK